jgi:hypothetical protein
MDFGRSVARTALGEARTRLVVAAAPERLRRRTRRRLAAAPTLARDWGRLAFARARDAATAANARVEVVGGAGLAAARLGARWIARAVDAIGGAALSAVHLVTSRRREAAAHQVAWRWPAAALRTVASRWPAVVLHVQRAARRLASLRQPLRPAVTPRGRRFEPFIVWTSRSCRSALLRARSARAAIARAAHAASSRYLFRALDALLTAPVAPDGEATLAGVFVPLRQAHFKRVQTAAKALEARWPRLALQIRESLVRAETLAFSAYGRPELLGYGAGSTVYRLRAEDGTGDTVLKVLRRSLGRDPAAVVLDAREAQAAYRRMATLYAGADIVMPTRYLVLQAPLLGRPAAACLQPCLPRGIRDLFDFTDDELIDLLRQDPILAAQFCLFVRRTVQSVRGTHSCVDLVGHNNVLILPTPEGRRMRLIDFGVMRLDDLLTRRPALAREVRRRLSRLARIQRALTREARRAPQRFPAPADGAPQQTLGDRPGETPCPR